MKIRFINQPYRILLKVWSRRVFRCILLFSFIISCSGSVQKDDSNNKNKTSSDNDQEKLQENEKKQEKLNFDSNGIIDINVSQKHPTLQLAIQDIAEVDYINLNNNNNDVLIEGTIAAFTKDKIIGYNFKSGDIFVLNNNGRLLKRFNHKGRGPGEYSGIAGLTIDAEADEMFINDMRQRKVHVYDINGEHKRTFPFIKGRFYYDIIFFNNNLICCDEEADHPITFFLVSKLDGTIIKDFKIPYDKKIASTFSYNLDSSTKLFVMFGYEHYAHPYKDQIILNEISSDTVFKLSEDHKLTPVASHSPSLPVQEPPGFLLLTAQTSEFTFFRKVIKEYNPETDDGFPSKEILFDRETGQAYLVELHNNDYETDSEFTIVSPITPGLL